MKRGSSLVYVCTSTPTKTSFKRRPNFKFSDSCLPKLVDYSFSDDDEDDSGNDSPCSLDESWDQLQMSLNSLASSLGSMDISTTPLSRGFNRHLRERASLKLKAEQDKQKARNQKVLNHLNESIGRSKTKKRVGKHIREMFASKTSLPEAVVPVSLKRQAKSLSSVDSKTELDTSVRVCEVDRQTKRRKMDFSVFSRFSSKRFSFKSKQKKVCQKEDNAPDTPKRVCLFSCFGKSGSYSVKKTL